MWVFFGGGDYRGKGLSLHHTINMTVQIINLFITIDANFDQMAEIVLIGFSAIKYPFFP